MNIKFALNTLYYGDMTVLRIFNASLDEYQICPQYSLLRRYDSAENFQCFARENLAIPDFEHGTHCPKIFLRNGVNAIKNSVNWGI